MALSKPVGAAAALTGAVAGIATIVGALAEPDTSACIAKVATALGPHGAAIGATVVGAITAIASIVAWFSHPPVPLSAQQQMSDDVTHGVIR